MRSLILSAFIIGATVIAGCGSSASTETAPAPEVAPLAVTAGTYVVDPSHSVLSFSVRHMGFATVTGTFASSEGQITIPESGIAGMSATATVAVESISMNNDDRDGHLKSPDFFDAANHPTLTLVTKSITPTGPNTFDLVADLTMRGTTKEVTLAGEYFGTVVDPWGNQKIALSATGTVDRFDYGLSWNKLIETGELVVSREVELELQVQAALVADQGAE